jgi:REP element-mobilizing transposase RayT
MARKLRVQYEGAIYHVTMRGVERRAIFKDDEDRERFLKRLGEAVEEFGLRLYLFSLLQNHIHLLIETPQANLSAFMHKLQTAYTVYYNLRHRRAGHLMQGRFGAEPVQGDTHLLKLTRYIHLNPVFVGRMRKEPLEVRRDYLRQYPWSSYRGYAGLAQPYDFVDESPIRRSAPRVGAAAVLDAVAKEFGLEPSTLRRRQYDCVARAVAAHLLGRYAGMNQRDAAGTGEGPACDN